jgi:hypothetical protein
LLAHGLWFFPDTPASSSTKIGRHDMAEILLKVALRQNKSINQLTPLSCVFEPWYFDLLCNRN